MLGGARVRLSGWQNTAVALGSAVGALLDPRRADLIAALGETTGKPAFEMVLERMKKSPEGMVPSFLIRKVYTQVFSFINVQLFNSLLLRRECCSFTNAEYVKMGLAELENWCDDASDEYVGSAWEELKHIRQAIGFLVLTLDPRL